jgi:sugar phosphate isomerase/epimerase
MKIRFVLLFMLGLCDHTWLQAQSVGVQLYSFRKQFEKDVPGTMAQVKALGVKEVELAGTYGQSREDFKRLLDQHGLKAVGTGVDFALLQDPAKLQGVIDEAKFFGCEYVCCFWIPHNGNEFGFADVNKAIAVFNEGGKRLKAAGLAFLYHPHGYEFRPHGTGTLFDELVKGTDAQYVNFEMDTFWAKHPGQDPVALLQKYPARWAALHLKDRQPGTPGNQNGQADVETNVVLGTGDVGIADIMRQARRNKIRYYIIEDESSRSLEQVPQSLRFLKSIK